jgi:class 3 adenylate cyclase/tetratricopeptide (TPR) repeat protein
MPIQRKLAAIMFTDIAGYTASMSKSESKSLDLLEKKRSILKPLLKEYNGTFVKEIGDGTLSYFESAVNAATCAVKLQEQTYDDSDMNIRAGIHIGDIVFKDGDVFGDGVNVASRLESIAPTGGVCVSKNVYDELLNQDDFDGVELGLQSLKGVGRLVEVFGLKGEKLNEPNPQEYKENEVQVHSDDEVPSIAIIPFENKGADEDAFFAYGISADLISDCSGAGLIRVASLKDVEKLDFNNMETSDLSEKLLVRYIAQGTLWKMGDMFQLSIELYDTKDKKVVWSDRWQEKWDNLATIKGSLSDGLLKALDTKPKVEQKVDTTNPEAYEFYLKAKHTYGKRKNTDDTDIARGLLKKAIELDGNLISAKVLLGLTYCEMGDYDEAMEIYTPSLKQAKELGDKAGMGAALNSIGAVHYYKSDYDTALDYYGRSLTIFEELGDKGGMGNSLGNIGIVHANKGDYETALDYFGRSLTMREELGDKAGMGDNLHSIGIVHANRGEYDKTLEYFDRALGIQEEIGDKRGMGNSLNNIGIVHDNRGEYEKALDYYDRSMAIYEEIGDKAGMGQTLNNIGIVHDNRGEYDKATKHLEKSLAIQKEIGLKGLELFTTTYLYISYKHLSKDYDEKDIHSLIKDAEKIEFELNFRLYQLLEDTSYLETAYKQVQENASEMDEALAKKFLSYPIPKAIVEEWEKVK